MRAFIIEAKEKETEKTRKGIKKEARETKAFGDGQNWRAIEYATKRNDDDRSRTKY